MQPELRTQISGLENIYLDRVTGAGSGSGHSTYPVRVETVSSSKLRLRLDLKFGTVKPERGGRDSAVTRIVIESGLGYLPVLVRFFGTCSNHKGAVSGLHAAKGM